MWYWKENAEAIFTHGYSLAGKVERDAFVFYLRASGTTTGLGKVYAKIEQVVRTTLVNMGHELRVDTNGNGIPYTENEIVDEYKMLILAMQGMWTAQNTFKWYVCRTKYAEDCPSKVHLTRENWDGTHAS